MNTGIPVGDGTGLVDISGHNCCMFERFTNESFWESADRLHRSPANERKLLSQQLGVAYVPGALIRNMHLRRHAKPATCSMFDVAHVTFVAGILQFEMKAFMDAAYAATRETASPFTF